MRIKTGDTVRLSNGEIGTVETIASYDIGEIALVRMSDNTLHKRYVSDLTLHIDDGVTLTRDEFKQYIAQTIDRETLETMNDDSYRMLEVTAELLFTRLEALIFGSVKNG